jgi:MoaA/NifB/PqqE/SkfB family radical SAM enzyme
MIFPIFTNATLVDEEYFQLFDQNRNILPILSLEGGREQTNARRGDGVYETMAGVMERFKGRGILFGVSVTVTKENMGETTSHSFLAGLCEKGARIVFYVEYVPARPETKDLAPGGKEREFLKERLSFLRKSYPSLLLISFPGDEEEMGGCLAAGRGFFHINFAGGVEPCPFSPYSDMNIRELSVREALSSPFLKRVREAGALSQNHEGGCALFEQQETVRALLKEFVSDGDLTHGFYETGNG